MCLVLQKPYGLHHTVADNVAISAGVVQLLDPQPSRQGIYTVYDADSLTTAHTGCAGMHCR